MASGPCQSADTTCMSRRCTDDESVGLVVTALRRAEADVLQKYATVNVHKSLDRERQSSATSSDVAHQALSDESGQLVLMALDHAQDQYLQHQCTFEGHSSSPVNYMGIVGVFAALQTD